MACQCIDGGRSARGNGDFRGATEVRCRTPRLVIGQCSSWRVSTDEKCLEKVRRYLSVHQKASPESATRVVARPVSTGGRQFLKALPTPDDATVLNRQHGVLREWLPVFIAERPARQQYHLVIVFLPDQQMQSGRA